MQIWGDYDDIIFISMLSACFDFHVSSLLQLTGELIIITEAVACWRHEGLANQSHVPSTKNQGLMKIWSLFFQSGDCVGEIPDMCPGRSWQLRGERPHGLPQKPAQPDGPPCWALLCCGGAPAADFERAGRFWGQPLFLSTLPTIIMHFCLRRLY